MKRRVRVTIVKHYEITDEQIEEGSYGNEVRKLYDEGAIEQAFAMALSHDAGNVPMECTVDEMLEWSEEPPTIKFEFTDAPWSVETTNMDNTREFGRAADQLDR